MSDSSDQVSPNDIAIVGMALRVPGAADVGEFWANLRNGVESIRDLVEEELIAAGETSARIHHPNYVRRTADMPAMEMFDAEFFGLSPKEAAIMDPQHRQFLECAWEAMEDAGRTPDSSAGPVGVFAGCGMGSYFYFNVCSNRQLVDQVGMFLLRHTGNDKDFLATRASFTFDLRGPSINVQTACSTSLVAVHSACQSLLAGECEMAIAGGVTIELPHRRGYLYQEGEILSPDGHCRAFDHRAAGTVFGSGVGVVALRRLSDALADGDIIHAVIKGTAVNNDGASKAGYLAPSVTGQAEAIIEAQGLAGVDADTIQYVECHGTGTYLGDPIEIEALTQAFRQSTDRVGFCRVGSVKSNIGHLDTAAGVVSLIKAALAVKHGEMPPTLGFERPNPSIGFERSPFVVNDRLTRWPETSGPRRAAVNSLGVGGTNAHAIIEQAPSLAGGGGVSAEDAPQLFVFAAKNRKALDRATERLGEALARRPDLSMADAAHTLYVGRKHFEHRRVIAARGRQEAIALLSGSDSKRAFTHSAIEKASGPVFLFPGGGAQHVGMARALYETDDQFRATVDEGISCLDRTAAEQIRRVWLDRGTGRAEAEAAFLRPSVQLPAILIVEVAVARWWIRQGVKPAALIGHSMGENAAACIAGVMSLHDAVNLVRLRGELFDTVEAGGMLSVPLSASALAEILPSHLDLASVNAPELCVVSGRDEDLDRFRATLQQQGIDASRIAIDIAAHSRMLEPILDRFESFLRGIRLDAPAIAIVSNVTGAWLSETEARDPLYWVRHLRSTVQFAKGVALLAEQPGRVFVEVGPGRALSSLVKLQPGIGANQVINSLPHAEDETDDGVHLLAALGRAWAVGLDVPLHRLWQGARRVSLPTYPFQHQRYFIERNAAAPGEPAEELLRKLPDMADWGHRPTWRQSLPDVAVDAEKSPASFLVFLDRAGFGEPLVESLRAGGHKVATVELGDTFARLSADAYSLCPEDGRAGYDALFSGIAAVGPLPTRILHLWLVTANEDHRPGSSFFNQSQEWGLYSLFHLAQALGDAGSSDGLQLTVVTNGMQRVGDEALRYPEKATILGPGLVIPKEMPGVNVRLIDLQLSVGETVRRGLGASRRPRGKPSDTTAALHDQLRDDLFAAPGSEVVAYRKGRRWLRGYERLPLAAPVGETAAGFRHQGVYVVTGGLGDLALVMARDLCERFDARLMLVGRTVLPPRAQWPLHVRSHPRQDRARRAIEQIAALQAQGRKIAYMAADVGNPEEMAAVAAATRAEFGQINGVIHAAGVVDDDLLQLKTVADMEAVLTPKLHGTSVMDNVFRDVPLDLFVLFSSTSTDTAPAGQIDYVAANAYLNAYAESRAGDATRKTVAVHWGVWNEVGLAARATARSDRAPSAGHVVEPARGPFFGTWVEDGQGTPWLQADIGPATHWMLDEHRMVSGEPVLPGTAYVEIIAQAMAEYGLDGTASIEDLVFLRPLVVADGESLRLRVRIAPRKDGHRIEVTAGRAADGDQFFEIFAEALIRPLPSAVTGQPDLAAVARRCEVRERAAGAAALRSVQEAHVRFGPRWQVLRSVAFGQAEALAELQLPDAYRGDATLIHPALLDIATGFAMTLDAGYDGTVLWAPMSYGRIAVHGRLPDRVVSWARLSPDMAYGDGYASFDISIADAEGNVVLEIERFVMKRLDSDLGLVAQRARKETPAAARIDSDVTSSPAAIQLAAQVSQGILPGEGFEALLRALATGETQPIVSSMELDALRRRAALPAAVARPQGDHFERPDLDSDYVAPRNEIERTLAGFWSELLGVEKIGVDDSFFDIGGHSLIAVRLFRMIKKEFAVDLPISVLFEAPTIAACAELIGGHQAAVGVHTGAAEADSTLETTMPVHLVAMSAGRDPSQTPLFLCAGMFGNVLNLRQLALQIGTDRAVYGLQARGLYGDQEPHETFEEMARDYLAEIRAVQPRGPYLLGGFSGGGLAAYEMAQQLRRAGEEVALLVMLDTPLPFQAPLTAYDKVQMKLQDMRREKLSFVTGWVRDRMRWQAEQRLKREAAEAEGSGRQFQNAKIEAAFRRALARYELQAYPGKVLLLRPRLNVLYTLSGGRRLQEGRNVAMEDNGWTPYVGQLEVQEVAGDHDSMVLEPFVRVLAARMRRRLSAATPAESDVFRIAAE